MIAKIDNLTVRAQFIGTKSALFDDGSKDTASRHHRITVKNEVNGNEVAFDYYPSLMNPRVTSRDEILSALSCFIMDAYSGEMSLDDFTSEFGYNSNKFPVSQILEVYDACHDSYCKLQYLFEDDNDSLDSLKAMLEEEGL